MSLLSKNGLIFHKVTGILLLAGSLSLVGCVAPEKPDGADTEGFARIAQQLHARGDDAGAADFYTRAIQHSPDDPRIRKEYGEILEAHGDLVGAATQYRVALQIPSADSPDYNSVDIKSDNVDLLRSYGRVLIKTGQPAVARPVFSRAVQVDPTDMRSLNGLGVALDQLNSHEAAQKVYNQALEISPNDFATLANLGHSYVLSGSYDDAIKLLEPHLNDPGVTPTLRQNLAEAYGMSGMDADAERVSRLDLAPTQVKHNLAYYRSHRTHLMTSAAGLIADLGHFPTEEIAQVHVDDVKARFSAETEGLAVKAIPEVASIGGTPTFVVHVTGFEKTATLRTFCLKLKKQNIACTARMDL